MRTQRQIERTVSERKQGKRRGQISTSNTAQAPRDDEYDRGRTEVKPASRTQGTLGKYRHEEREEQGWDAADLDVARVDPNTMQLQEVVRHPVSESFGMATTALQVGNELWVGSLQGDRVARFQALRP